MVLGDSTIQLRCAEYSDAKLSVSPTDFRTIESTILGNNVRSSPNSCHHSILFIKLIQIGVVKPAGASEDCPLKVFVLVQSASDTTFTAVMPLDQVYIRII